MIRKKHYVLTFAVLISVLLHGGAFLISYLFFPEHLERALFRVRLAPQPLRKQRRFVGRGIRIPKVTMEMLEEAARPEGELKPSELGEGLPSEIGVEVIVPPGEGKLAPGVKKPSGMELEPEIMVSTEDLATRKELPSLKSELLRMEDLAKSDRHKALVIIDSDDKRNVTGYLNMTMVRTRGGSPYGDLAVPNLMRYMRDYTKILARIRGHAVNLYSSELFTVPFIFLFEGGGKVSSDPRRLIGFDSIEVENLGKYLRGGGFLFAEGSLGFRREMKDYLKAALGGGARFFRIPDDHALYHSFYDFYDRAPGEPSVTRQPGDEWLDGLWGVELDGRLVALISSVYFYRIWGMDSGVKSESADGQESEPPVNKERQLQFGVNLIVFALTQPGGLAMKGFDGSLPEGFLVTKTSR